MESQSRFFAGSVIFVDSSFNTDSVKMGDSFFVESGCFVESGSGKNLFNQSFHLGDGSFVDVASSCALSDSLFSRSVVCHS